MTRGELFILVAFILIHILFYGVYIYRSNSSPDINLKTNRSEFEISAHTNSKPTRGVNGIKTKNINALIKELGIPHSKWMDQPITNPFPYNYLHNPKKACFNKSVDIFIGVFTSRSNLEQRQAIRDTWGSYSKNPSNKAVLLFFIGNASATESPNIQQRINKESKRHFDIVQSQFIDTYGNLSLKTLSLLKWVDAYCSQTTFLTKADDDVYLVVPNLVRRLRETTRRNQHRLFILGFAVIGAIPIQSKNSKWYTPRESYSETVYPRYASGTTYSMPGKTARLLYQTALRTPLFWLEDIYITGLCAQKADIPVICDEFHTYKKLPASGCQFRKQVTGHRYSVAELRKIHKELKRKSLACPGLKKKKKFDT